MEYEITWSPNSIKCIHSIGVDLVKRDSILNANKVVSAIRDRIAKLKILPNSGRVVPELNDTNILEVIVRKKRVIYEISGQSVYILAVIPERLALINYDSDWIWPNK
jgi:toxin ParE1/3/4